MRRQLVTGLLMTIALIVLLGLVYPLAMTGIAQLMKNKANGSFVTEERQGRRLVADRADLRRQERQPDPRYFQSAVAPVRRAAAAEQRAVEPNLIGNVPGGIDTRPTRTHGRSHCVRCRHRQDDPVTTGRDPSTRRTDGLRLRSEHVPNACCYRKLNGLGPKVAVPVDAVTASASGLDPDISVANARLQAPRVARERSLPVAQVLALVTAHTQRPPARNPRREDRERARLNLALDAQ